MVETVTLIQVPLVLNVTLCSLTIPTPVTGVHKGLHLMADLTRTVFTGMKKLLTITLTTGVLCSQPVLLPLNPVP